MKSPATFAWIVRCIVIPALIAGGAIATQGAAPALASQRLERHVNVDGLDRRYIIWLPDGYRQRGPLPVVLAFHGGFGSAEVMENNSDLHDARGAQNFVIVYPEGYEKSWNLVVCCGPAMRQHVDDLKFVRMLLGDLESVVRIDRRRIYASGFSNGAQFTYYLACHLSDQIAAVATLSASMQQVSECHPTRPIAVFHFHGLADRVAPFRGGPSAIRTAPYQPPVQQGIEFWSRFDGTQVGRRESLFGPSADCVDHAGGRDRTRVVLCVVPGMGHRWPGSHPMNRSPRAAAILGPLGPPLDASSAILEFFRDYALP